MVETDIIESVCLPACRNLHLLEDQRTRKDMVTVTTGASAYLGGYALKGAPASKNLKLSDDFLAQVRNVYDALGGGQEQERTRQLFTNFGTHYINRVWYGGLGEHMFSPFHLASPKRFVKSTIATDCVLPPCLTPFCQSI